MQNSEEFCNSLQCYLSTNQTIKVAFTQRVYLIYSDNIMLDALMYDVFRVTDSGARQYVFLGYRAVMHRTSIFPAYQAILEQSVKKNIMRASRGLS